MSPDGLSGGVAHLLRKNRVAVFDGAGRLDGPGWVAVATRNGQERLQAPHILLATGGARAQPARDRTGR